MTWIGLDVHARSVEASVVDSLTGEMRRRRVSGSDVGPIVDWMGTLPGPVRACYEAGPTGYGLARAARAAGIAMEVIAPSKTPRKPGDRIKTDRRDAELLVRQLMAGALTAVRVPSVVEEAARDVVRSREQIRRDLMRARHRVSKLLLRNGRVYPVAAGTWTQAHREWLSHQRFDEADLNLVYLDALAAVDGLQARRDALTERLSRIAQSGEWWPTVARLRAFRGVDTHTALGVHLELGDWSRFERATDVGAYLGLVPTLNQSGEGSTSGGITKTGSQYARRLLVEAAWHYTRQPRIGVTLANRQQGLPDHVLQIAWRAQHRLYRMHTSMRERGKHANVANAARARQLACFLWAAATAP
ncbi:MAG TPA: IS110 family transposase [Gaiellales bacterium]|jgi:transposase